MIVYKANIEIVDDLPPFYKIAEFLWGKNANVDSDGNSETPEDRRWSELTLILREDESQRIDIDPIADDPKKLVVRANSNELLLLVVDFLNQCGSIKLEGLR